MRLWGERVSKSCQCVTEWGGSHTPRIESQPTSGSIGEIHAASSLAAPAKCRREPAEHDAAGTLGARAAAAPRRAIERLNCLSITQDQQNFADGMPFQSEAQTSGAALRLGLEAWEGAGARWRLQREAREMTATRLYKGDDASSKVLKNTTGF
jgi:hypothetical protein